MRTSKLSDSYQPPMDSPNLELVVSEININLGINDEYLKKCKPLFEYMQYIDRVRTYAELMSTQSAVEKAVNECIQEGILSEFLIKNKSEAIQMSIFEYDEEKELKLIKQDERDMGREEGLMKGREEDRIKRARLLIKYDLEHHVAQEIIIQRMQEVFDYQQEDVQVIIREILESK